MARRTLAGLMAIGLVWASGCSDGAFSASVWNPLGLRPLFGLGGELGGEPVRIGIAREQSERSLLNPVSWIQLKKTPWLALRRELSKELKRPVVVERLKPFQIAAHLQSGWIQFALLPASDYLALSREVDIGRVVALSEAGWRRGLIVAAAESGIETLQDIRGRRFAFGPKDDEVLHVGPLKVLADAGIGTDDLAKELVPIPGGLQYHISSLEAAKEIIYGVGIGKLRTQVGVIEESDYESFPDTGGRLLPLPTYSKDQFRILGRTERVRMDTIADGPVVASPETDAELVAAVQTFLLAAAEDHKPVVRDLGLKRFRRPSSHPRAQIERLSMLAPNNPPTKQPG